MATEPHEPTNSWLEERLIAIDDELAERRGESGTSRVRSHARRVDHLTMWPLTRHSGSHGLQAYKIRIDPVRAAPPDPLPTHEGHEWLYVLSGRLRLVLGEEEVIAAPGEAVEFSTLLPHWFGCVDEAVEVIALFGPHGERVHLRA